MKILCFSPIELPYTVGVRYTGLEKLAVQFAEEWQKLGHDVTIIAHKDTNVSRKVTLLPCDGYINKDRTIHAEQKAFQQYHYLLRNFDAIWDIGHLHLVARAMPNMPVVSVFSANPEYEARAGNEKAPYNLISWSKWGVGQIRKHYGRNALYQETIMVDPQIFKPNPAIERNDRFLTLGRMSPPKGNLNAVMLCKKLNLPLDVAGGRGSEMWGGEQLTEYEKSVKDLCDGKQIIFHGEIDDEYRIELQQSNKALLYITDHVEITSHKVQECMFCGMPVIIPNHGGMPEIVTHGEDGILCLTEADYVEAINNLDKLHKDLPKPEVVEKYRPENVARDYITLLEKVANGLRW